VKKSGSTSVFFSFSSVVVASQLFFSLDPDWLRYLFAVITVVASYSLLLFGVVFFLHCCFGSFFLSLPSGPLTPESYLADLFAACPPLCHSWPPE